MDRLDFSIDAIIAYHRTQDVLGANSGQDDDLDPEHRRNRTEVSPGCPLKTNDHLELYSGAVKVVCVGPGRGEGWFTAWWFDDTTGATIGTMDIQYISDRAPADPEEAPGTWPWVPPPGP